MGLLAELKSKLDETIKNDTLTFSQNLTGYEAVDKLVEALPDQILVLNTVNGDDICFLDGDTLKIYGDSNGSQWNLMAHKDNATLKIGLVEIAIEVKDNEIDTVNCKVLGVLKFSEGFTIDTITEWHGDENLWEMYQKNGEPHDDALAIASELYPSDSMVQIASDLLKTATAQFQMNELNAVFTPDGKTHVHTVTELAPTDDSMLTLIESPLVGFDGFNVFFENSYDDISDPDTGEMACQLEGRVSLFDWNPIDVSMTVYDPFQVWKICVKPDVALPSLSQVAKLVEGFSIDEFLEPVNSSQSAISISDLEIGFLPDDMALKSVKLSLTQADKWIILQDFLAVKINDITLDLHKNDEWEADAYFDGTLFLTDIEFGVLVSVPSLNISGSLNKDTPIALKTFLQKLCLPNDILPAEIREVTISEIDFFANGKPENINFGANVRIENLIQLDNLFGSSLSAAVDYLALGIEFNYSDEQKIGGEVKGGMALYLDSAEMSDVNKMSFDIGFELHDKAVFTAKAENIHLSEIVEFLIDDDLPQEIPDVVLKELEFTLNSEKKVHIHGEVELKEKEDANLTIGDQEIALGSLEFSFTKSPGEFECRIIVKGENIPTIDGIEIELKKFEFSFDYKTKDNKTEWQLSGTVNGRIFNHDDLSLKASYKNIKDKETEKSCFALTYEDGSKQPCIEIPNLVALEVSKIDLGIEREKSGDKSKTSWHILAAGGLQVSDLLNPENNLLEIDGELSLEYSEGTTYKFVPITGSSGHKGATLSLPLPVYADETETENPSLDFTFEKLEFGCKTSNEQKKTWECKASSSLAFNHIPDAISAVINSDEIKISSELKLNNDGIDFTVSDSIAMLEFDYPHIELSEFGNTDIYLGKGAVGLDDFRLQVTNDDIKLAVKTKLGLPSKLNAILGETLCLGDDFELFTVYNPDDTYSSTIDMDIGFGIKNGLFLNLSSSPFTFISIEKKRDYDDDGNVKTNDQGEIQHKDSSGKYIYVELEKLGTIGEFEFEVPKFSLDTSKGALTAKGGFEIVRDIEIPLTLLKNLLNQNNISESLPESIPLKGIEFFDSDGNFEMDSLISEFKNFTGIDLPDEIRILFEYVVKSVFDKLPNRLKPYLNLTYPKGFHFNLAITPDGGCKVDLSGHGDKKKDGDDDNEPIRLLIPAMSGIFPTLYGIEFNSFSFGELLSGLFLSVEVDMNIDQFDLLSIIISLLVSDLADLDPDILDALHESVSDELKAKLNQQQLEIIEALLTASEDVMKAFISVAKYAKTIIAEPTALQTTLIIEKLFMLIIYESGIPIPIPVFYNKLGIEFTYILDFTVQSHISFPAPSLNLTEIGKTVLNFGKFFTDYQYELPVEGDEVPTDFNLTFTAENNYVELPELLGGNVLLGSKGENFSIDAYKTIANFLNAVKKISLDKVIKAIPYKNRIGTKHFAFGPISIDADYFLSTSDEIADGTCFNDTDYLVVPDRLTIDDSFTEMAAGALQTFEDVSGMPVGNEYSVVFLSGEFGMKRVMQMGADFGLIATSSNDFITGFHLSGAYSNIVALQLSGAAFLIKATEQDGLKATTFQISADTALTLFDVDIFTAHGLVRIDGESFYTEGDIKAFPESFPVHAECGGSLQINGNGTFKLVFDSNAHITLCGLDIIRGEESFYIELKEDSFYFDAHLNERFGLIEARFDCTCDIQKESVKGAAETVIKYDDTVLLNNDLNICLDVAQLTIDGHVSLLPDLQQLIQFEGTVNGLIANDNSVKITGNMNTRIAGFPFSSCNIHIENNLFYFKAMCLGINTKFTFSNKNGKLLLSGTVNLSAFSIETTSSISSTAIESTLTCSVANSLELSSTFKANNTSQTSGDLLLKLFNARILKGDISISKDAYRLSGSLNVFPAGSPIQYNINTSGTLNKKGINLEGSSGINVLSVFTMNTTAKINNGLPSFNASVSLLGISLSGSAGLYKYKNNIAFCLSYTTPWIVFIPPITYYLMISPSSLYGPSTSKPGDWPGQNALKEDTSDSEERIDIEFPGSQESLEHIEALLTTDYSTSENDVIPELFATMALYDVTFEIIEENGEWKREIILTKKDYLSNIDDNIFNLLPEEKNEIDSLKIKASQTKTTVVIMANNFELTEYAMDYKGKTRMSFSDAFQSQVVDLI